MSSSFVSPPWYYRAAIAILKPLYRMQVWRRSHKRDNYQQEVDQRFGRQYPTPPQSQAAGVERGSEVIWCHAVSLGETNTAAPLLEALMAKGYAIWLTNTTQTGFARGAKRFANDIEHGRLSHSYVPVDSPVVIERFLTHIQPIAALFVETELWANILTKLSQKNIPSILVNGRLSAASFRRYQKIEAVSASMMQNLSLIIAQDAESAKRFRQLGALSTQIRLTGSLKWVINTPTSKQAQAEPDASDLIKLKALNRPSWVAASTHEGEEEAALSMQQRLVANSKFAQTLLIIVPRHPERFDEVADLIKATGLTLARRSLHEPISAQTQVYLADTMGELMHWYQLADVALVGGSLVDIGGHNPVEPASVATPIIMGRYTQSCQSVVDKLAKVGALYQPNNEHYCFDSSELSYRATANKPNASLQTLTDSELIYQQLTFWLSHLSSAKAAGQAAAELTSQQQSVLEQQVTMIETVIEQRLHKAVYE